MSEKFDFENISAGIMEEDIKISSDFNLLKTCISSELKFFLALNLQNLSLENLDKALNYLKNLDLFSQVDFREEFSEVFLDKISDEILEKIKFLEGYLKNLKTDNIVLKKIIKEKLWILNFRVKIFKTGILDETLNPYLDDFFEEKSLDVFDSRDNFRREGIADDVYNNVRKVPVFDNYTPLDLMLEYKEKNLLGNVGQIFLKSKCSAEVADFFLREKEMLKHLLYLNDDAFTENVALYLKNIIFYADDFKNEIQYFLDNFMEFLLDIEDLEKDDYKKELKSKTLDFMIFDLNMETDKEKDDLINIFEKIKKIKFEDGSLKSLNKYNFFNLILKLYEEFEDFNISKLEPILEAGLKFFKGYWGKYFIFYLKNNISPQDIEPYLDLGFKMDDVMVFYKKNIPESFVEYFMDIKNLNPYIIVNLFESNVENFPMNKRNINFLIELGIFKKLENRNIFLIPEKINFLLEILGNKSKHKKFFKLYKRSGFSLDEVLYAFSHFPEKNILKFKIRTKIPVSLILLEQIGMKKIQLLEVKYLNQVFNKYSEIIYFADVLFLFSKNMDEDIIFENLEKFLCLKNKSKNSENKKKENIINFIDFCEAPEILDFEEFISPLNKRALKSFIFAGGSLDFLKSFVALEQKEFSAKNINFGLINRAFRKLLQENKLENSKKEFFEFYNISLIARYEVDVLRNQYERFMGIETFNKKPEALVVMVKSDYNEFLNFEAIPKGLSDKYNITIYEISAIEDFYEIEVKESGNPEKKILFIAGHGNPKSLTVSDLVQKGEVVRESMNMSNSEIFSVLKPLLSEDCIKTFYSCSLGKKVDSGNIAEKVHDVLDLGKTFAAQDVVSKLFYYNLGQKRGDRFFGQVGLKPIEMSVYGE